MKRSGESPRSDANADNTSTAQKESYAGIKIQLHTLTDQVVSSFTGSEDDKDHIFLALESIEKLEIITEEDKYEYLLALCQLSKLYMDKFPEGEEIREISETYNNYNALLYYLYSTDSLYNKANVILYEFIGNLSKREDADESFVNAIGKTSALPFSNEPDDNIIRGKALARIISANLAYDWFLYPHPAESIEDPGEKEFAKLMDYLEIHAFNKSEIINTFDRVEELGKKYTGDFTQLSMTLLRIYGIGILLSPQSAPALEILENRVVELSMEYAGQTIRSDQNIIDTTPRQKTAEEIVSAFTALVKKDGTSVYAFDQAVTELKRLPQVTEEDYSLLMESLVKICDIGIEYSPDESISGPIEVTKENLQKSMAMVTGEKDPYTAKEVKEILEQNIVELKQNLAKGENPETAIARGLGNIMSILPVMPTDDEQGEEVLKILMEIMTKDFMGVIGNYITEDKMAVWKETMKTMGFVSEAVDHPHDGEVDSAIDLERFEEQNERLINAGLQLPISNEAMSNF